MMNNDKILEMIQMRMSKIPYSVIAYKLEENEAAVKKAARNVIECLAKDKQHQKTSDALSQVPYVNVVRYIVDNGLTLKDFSAMCNVSLQYMSKALKNHQGMPVQNVIRISKVTGMPIHEVYYMNVE